MKKAIILILWFVIQSKRWDSEQGYWVYQVKSNEGAYGTLYSVKEYKDTIYWK